MKKFKGTPGPWYWDEEGLGNKNHIVFGKEYHAEMTSKANKALISAAPELLEALQETIHEVGYWLSTQKPELKEKIESAIKKALGE